MKPEDAYREGYERGKTATLAERFGDAFFTMLRDDPGGYFEAGYYDGAAGKRYKVRGAKTNKPLQAPKQFRAQSTATDFERRWYRLCNSSEFISEEIAAKFKAALLAEGNAVAFVIGLSDFADHVCPRCSAAGHFKMHFLGSLNHPSCGWRGFMKTGAYIGHQVAQIFHTGFRAGASMKEDADKKERSRGNWLYGVFGFLFVAVFRAAAAVVLIPLHCIGALFQSGQSTTDIVTRVITLVVMAAGIGFSVYTINTAPSRAQSPVSQQFYAPLAAPPAKPESAPLSQPSPQRLSVDLAAYCRSHGYRGVRNKDGTGYGWFCTPGDASIDVDQACKEQYGSTYSVSLSSSPPGGMNDWFCHQ